MKKINRLFAIMVMIVLLMTSLLPVSVFADSSGDIVINAAPNQSLDGQTFTAYQIFTLTVDANHTAYSYTLNDEFKEFFYEFYEPSKIYLSANSTYTASDFIASLEGNETDRIALSKALTNWINDGYFIDESDTVTVYTEYGTGSQVIIGNVPYGYYLVTGSMMPDETNVVTALSALVTVDGKQTSEVGDPSEPDNSTITLKADAPTIEKKVEDHGNGFGKSTDIEIGESVRFILTSKIPNMQGYSAYIFTVHDEMSKGLDYEGNVSVEIGDIDESGNFVSDETISEGNSTYEVTSSGGNGNPTLLTITFDPDYFVALPSGKYIRITYSATLNQYAEIGMVGNSNKAWLEYSNNPNQSGTGTTPESPGSEAKVYTFDAKISKVTSENRTGLKDAEFKLYSEGEGGDPIELICEGDIYRPFISNDTIEGKSPITTLVSPEGGKFEIHGLAAGTYFLEETKAPDGYNLLTERVRIKITKTGEDGDYIVEGVTNDGYIEVENNTGILFPETGGIGRTMFILVGAIMIGAGLVALVVFRKKIFGSK